MDTPPDKQMERRDKFLEEAFRGLLLVHGGAAVALLAFFQSLIAAQLQLARVVLVALLFLAGGLVLTIVFMILRYYTSLRQERGDPRWERMRWAYSVCMWLSLGCFALAIVLVVAGGFYLLPQHP